MNRTFGCLSRIGGVPARLASLPAVPGSGRLTGHAADRQHDNAIVDARLVQAYELNTGRKATAIQHGSQWAYGLPGFGVWTNGERAALLDRTTAA